MSPSDVVKVDFSEGDGGQSAVDRTFRTTVLIVSNAIHHLIENGWSRDEIRIEVDESTDKIATIYLNDDPIFLIGPGRDLDDGSITIKGFWLGPAPSKIEKPTKKSGTFKKILRWLGVSHA